MTLEGENVYESMFFVVAGKEPSSRVVIIVIIYRAYLNLYDILYNKF